MNARPTPSIVVAALALLAPAALAQPEALDPSFDGDGLATVADGVAFGVALQPDGRIVLAGGEGRVLRLNADGSPDDTFGSGGSIVVDLGGPDDQLNGVVLQPDGRIVAAGGRDLFSECVAVRLTAEGALDAAFGTGGIAFTGVEGLCLAPALQPDGRVVLAGFTSDSLALVRLLSDGTPDPSFGTGGVVLSALGREGASAFDVALQPDGWIVAAAIAGSSSAFEAVVARFTPGGALDPTFGTGGVAPVAFGDGSLAYGVALDAAGRIVVVGVGDQTAGGVRLARLTPGGAPDPTFGTSGVVAVPDAFAYDVAVQPDGKPVVAGHTLGDASDFELLRFTETGALDPDFGTNGVATADFGGRDEAYALALQPDGRAVLVGETRGTGGGDIAAARFLSDGRPNASEPAAPTLAFTLGSAMPNPAEATTVLPLTLPAAAEVRAEVFNALGQRLALLHDGPLPASTHALRVKADGLAAGVYLVRVTADGHTATQRLTVAR